MPVGAVPAGRAVGEFASSVASPPLTAKPDGVPGEVGGPGVDGEQVFAVMADFTQHGAVCPSGTGESPIERGTPLRLTWNADRLCRLADEIAQESQRRVPAQFRSSRTRTIGRTLQAPAKGCSGW